MSLDHQLGRWVQRTQHVRDTLDQVICSLPDDDLVLFEHLFGTLQGLLEDHLHAGDGDAPPDDGVLAEAVNPFVTSLRDFESLTTAPRTTSELRELLAGLRDSAQTTFLALTTDDRLAVQTVEDVIADFSQEFRISLILALTSNFALSQTLVRWQEGKSSDSTTGNYLDLTTMNFVSQMSDRTIAMSTLSTASTTDPVVITPMNLAASMKTLTTGGTPPQIYGLAYTQWFTTIHAAWEDTYRPRLAAAHCTDETGTAWTKNDIRSEFFNEVRQIRNDISHKKSICIESAGNTLIDWLEPGKIIAPNPQQMLGLLDLFPFDELRRAPTRVPRATGQLPYSFDLEWIEKVKGHIEAHQPVKKKRSELVKQIIDDWMCPPHSA